MSRYSVPSGHGYMEIPLQLAERKPLKSVQVYQMEETLNLDLEFDDHSRLEIIFSTGFQASAKLLDHHEGSYRVSKKLKPKHLPE